MDLSIGYILVTVLVVSGYTFDSANGVVCNGIEPCVSLESANAQYQKCCLSKDLGSPCAKHCRYDADLKEVRKDTDG